MISFQEVKESNIPLLRDLAKKSWETAYAEILSAEQIAFMLREMYSEEVISEQINNPHYFYYFIKVENIDIGFVGYEIHYEEDTTKLHRIYLIENAKGKGVGKVALKFLIQKVLEVGNHRIILNVNRNNPAQYFYKSLGFTVYEEGIFDIGNGFVMDDYLMEIRL